MITSREYWNRRSALYDAKIGKIYHEAYQRTIHLSKRYLKNTDHVLDFGCGTGIITVEIAPRVASLRAIDISDNMISLTGRKLASRGIKNTTVEQMNIFDSSLEHGSFDVICAFNILNYLNDREDVIRRIRALLKPGGYFLSVTDCLGERLTSEGLRKWYSHQKGETPTVVFDTTKSLRNLISDGGFKLLECQNLYNSPPNYYIAAQKPME